ncbi:MAG: N-acetylmuramoyl-L-alanine amidase [Oscillospiraceae bacterium]|nr:N-acetylmuramoyl-L-alanine amidase [Oscillospiraceae bacterium]
MNIVQDFIPVGRRNRPGRVSPMRFITIHNTGNSDRGANARAHNTFIRSTTATNAPISWHYTVDEREIFQHLPDNEDAFHAGDGAGPGNRQSIGIEICQNADGDLLAANNRATELTALLCRRYNIQTTNIVQHHHWNGKSCPQMLRSGRPYDWHTFLARVRGAIQPPPAPAPPTFTPYRVHVTAARGLNIRRGAGTNYARVGALPRNTQVTVVAESDGQGARRWGRLLNGRGWIALDFTAKM